MDFDTDGDGFDGSLELDYYGGWSGTFGSTDDWGVDVGYIYYDYPGDEGVEGDYQEDLPGSFSWRDLSMGVH